MAKLIGHYFNTKQGYSTFEISGLEETEKMYRKVPGVTVDGTPKETCYEVRKAFHKATDLCVLRRPFTGMFLMFAEEDKTSLFRTLVIQRLTGIEEQTRGAHEAALKNLAFAKE
jgi:hypothetical protein